MLTLTGEPSWESKAGSNYVFKRWGPCFSYLTVAAQWLCPMAPLRAQCTKGHDLLVSSIYRESFADLDFENLPGK